IVTRRDSMSVAISSLPILRPDAAQDFHRDGFLVVRNLFTPAEMQEGLNEADRLFQRRDLIVSENIRCRWQPHVETPECLFECFDPVIDISPVCDKLAHDSRLLQVLGDLYGEEACLFKDKLIFKPPGAKGYDLHQDFIAWPNFPRSFLTAVIALDNTDV